MDRRAWLVVAGLSLASGLVLGLTMIALGIFVGPIERAFQVSAAEAAEATTAYLLFMTFGAPLCGWLIDRFGTAPVATLGAVAVAAGCFVGSRSESLPLYVAAMSLAGLGAGASTYVPSTLVIRSRAPEHAALALGAYLAAVALLCSVTPVLVSHLLGALGWRSTLRLIALVIAVIAVPILGRLARARPTSEHAAASHGEGPVAAGSLAAALGGRGFWLIALVQVLAGLAFQQVYTYIVPYLLACGYSPARSSMIFGLTNATSALGFFLFGLLADRAGPLRALVTGAVLCGLSTPLLLGAGEAGIATLALAVFVALWGATCSLPNQFVPLLLGGIVGERHFAAALGLSFVIYGMAGAAGPPITGYLVDQTHGYTAPFLLAASLMLMSAVPALGLRRLRNA